MSEEVRTFHAVDYVVFALSLALSAFIGVFHGLKGWCLRRCGRVGGGAATSGLSEQLLGGQDMQPLPVALSLLASFLSAPFLLGTPAELYMYGTMYAAIMIGYLLAGPVTAHLFVPIFHRQELTSSYEFLEKRFNPWIRLLGSLLFSFMMILYMAVVVYAPAVAFAQVTGLDELISILGVGFICTFYTAFGGMKAVVWTDALQMVIILVGMLALIIEGTLDVGGPSEVWRRVIEGNRIDTDELSLNPTARHTWWTQSIGGFFVTLSITATNQAMIQRYLSIKTTKDAQKSVYYALIFQELYLVLIIMLGLVMYAFYYYCDPVTSGKVFSKDQLVPIFVMDSLGDWIGLPGLFSASVFSASLSTVSSGVNALAAVILSDMILPIYKQNHIKPMPDKWASYISKGLSAGFGLLTIGLAFVAPFLGSTLLQVAMTVFGMVGGPLLGLFILAMFFPCANQWGAGVGMFASLGLTCWLTVGGIIYPSIPERLPLRTDGCGNITIPPAPNKTVVPDDGFTVKDLYSISYMWYAALSVVVAVIVGLITSFITGGHKQTKDVDPDLIYSFHRKCTPCYNLCGCVNCCPVDEEEEKEEAKDYGVFVTEKRMSLETVRGIYTEDPMQKRTSIDVQFGPVGRIGEFSHGDSLPRHLLLAQRGSIAPNLSPTIEEDEDGEDDVMHGVSNPAFINDSLNDGGYEVKNETEISVGDNEMRTAL